MPSRKAEKCFEICHKWHSCASLYMLVHFVSIGGMFNFYHLRSTAFSPAGISCSIHLMGQVIGLLVATTYCYLAQWKWHTEMEFRDKKYTSIPMHLSSPLQHSWKQLFNAALWKSTNEIKYFFMAVTANSMKTTWFYDSQTRGRTSIAHQKDKKKTQLQIYGVNNIMHNNL